ncbi:hypothetical protein OCU04_005586 [Sclerotinia nivalis]|uniref:Uncharacterized protein n=1 Tax=Sclerotinia nivalis TaxID=352851 RepID=A0A9X0APF1_9HELO|nr:hypothetical protein OCU04_005586 [Sclerotinia nivalis]
MNNHKKLINANSVNVQSRKRKSFESHGPAKKRQCGENTHERGFNAQSPGRETSYQDNANSGRMGVLVTAVGCCNPPSTDSNGDNCDPTYILKRHCKNPETSTSDLNYEAEALDVAINPVGQSADWCHDPAATFARFNPISQSISRYDPASTFASLAMQQWPYDIENLTSFYHRFTNETCSPLKLTLTTSND